MNIVVLYQYYQSENAPGHSLIYNWTHYLAEKGHNVTVIAGESGYMKYHPTSTLSWLKRFKQIEKLGMITVIRTYTLGGSHRNYFLRLLGYLSFSFSSAIALLTLSKPDVVIASSPPIFPVFSSWFISKCRRLPFIMEVRDLWPASAVQMGLLRNRWLIGLMSWMEKTLYSQSTQLIALTEGIQNNIVERGWPRSKVSLIRCGIDVNKLYPDSNGVDELCKRYRLQNKKIILYFGALGEANNISVILRTAQNLKNHSDIFFMLIGDGMKCHAIKQEISSLKLSNIAIYPPVPKEQARKHINMAHVGIVTLMDIPLFRGALPTKLLDYMACGIPVLCGVQGESERILNESHAGLTFLPNDDMGLANAILRLVNDPQLAKEMGDNGMNFINNHFNVTKMNKQIEDTIITALA